MIYDSTLIQKFTVPSTLILNRTSQFSKLMEYENYNISKINYEFPMK